VRRFDEAAEWACDELATSNRVPATEYASVLLKLCDGRPPQHAFLPAARGSSVSRRIRRLLAQTKKDSAMKKVIVCSIVALILAVGIFRVELVGEEVAADAKPSKRVQAMIDTAEMAWKASRSAYDAGTTAMDPVYTWSQHWLHASLAGAANQKQRLTAYLAHRERMQDLFNKVEALHQARSKGGEANKYFAAKFYLAEADMWLFDKFASEADKDLEKIPPLEKEPQFANEAVAIEFKIAGDVLEIKTKANGKELGFGGGTCKLGEFPPGPKAYRKFIQERGNDIDKIAVTISAASDTKYIDVKNLIDACDQAGFKKIQFKTTNGEEKPADKQSQIRRLYLDFTGLPPTQAEVDAFIKDSASDPHAYQKLVDRLLKSPKLADYHAAAPNDASFLEHHKFITSEFVRVAIAEIPSTPF
jgi:hypothetical protein